MTKPSKPAVLSIRNAKLADVTAISALVAKVYKDMPAYTPGMLRGQIAAFPDGQFVVEYSDEMNQELNHLQNQLAGMSI